MYQHSAMEMFKMWHMQYELKQHSEQISSSNHVMNQPNKELSI